MQYGLRDVVQFEGHRYEADQAHRSESDWAPSVTAALWRRIEGGPEAGGAGAADEDVSFIDHLREFYDE
ncbi:carbohydrate-binding protein [Streptomyces sp. NPDC090445]|uniref:carbohydrate-binding protein n=1 Tax=Streptomyces sp. NPDC090445 TaxID=3365963 RepID=UPI003805E170